MDIFFFIVDNGEKFAIESGSKISPNTRFDRVFNKLESDLHKSWIPYQSSISVKSILSFTTFISLCASEFFGLFSGLWNKGSVINLWISRRWFDWNSSRHPNQILAWWTVCVVHSFYYKWFSSIFAYTFILNKNIFNS